MSKLAIPGQKISEWAGCCLCGDGKEIHGIRRLGKTGLGRAGKEHDSELQRRSDGKKMKLNSEISTSGNYT